MKRGILQEGYLFYPIYKIFNHAAQHTKYIEWTITSCPRIRVTLANWTFLPDRQPVLMTTANLLTTIRTQTADNIVPLLRSLRAQHSHLYRTSRPNVDPDRYNPQSLLTHALHNVARTLNIPSS